MTAPGSYLAIDPGRRMGYAHCLRGGHDLQYGTWKFTHDLPGAAYSAFAANLKGKIDALPDVQVGLELMTIVAHVDDRGKASVNSPQVELSAGWPAMAHTLCFRLGARPPEMIAISAWRSRTHSFTTTPKGFKGDKRKFLKLKALEYCRAEGWAPANDEEAEALCLLVYLRLLFEPDYAFDRGHSSRHQAEMAL